MGCTGSTSNPSQTSRPTTHAYAPPEDIPTQGCYLTYDDDELFFKWANEDPEGTVIAFAKSGRPVPAGRLAKPARYITTAVSGDIRKPLFIVRMQTDETTFFKGLIDFVIEAAPMLGELSVREDAGDNAYMPFMFAVHQPGNNVIGDRVSGFCWADVQLCVQTLKGLPGKLPVPLDGVDCAAAVPLDSTVYDTRNQTLQEFIAGAQEANGAYTRLDASGRVPPT